MDRKRTIWLAVGVLGLVGCILLGMWGRHGAETSETLASPPHGGTTHDAARQTPDTPARPEPLHATSALPSRLVPATLAGDAADRLGAFEGRVISATTGEGVEGAELTFASAGGGTSTRTGAEGRFRFVPPSAGTWQLAGVTARGYLPFGPDWGQSPIRLTAVPGQRVSDLVLALTPDVEMSGKVVDPDDKPVSGAQVRVLTGRGGESVLFPTSDRYTSNEQGEFRFHAPEGATVEARHPAYTSARAEVTPSAVLAHGLTLKLGKPQGTPASTSDTLAGRVVEGGGAAVAGALVSVVSAASAWPRKYGDELGYEAVTNAEGRFSVEGLEPGSYDVTARLMGLAPGELRDVTAGRKDLVLTLAKGVTLTGTVREGASGKPLPSFTLAVFKKRGPLQQDAFAQLSFIDAQGHYEVAGVPPGSYVVQAAAHGYAPSEAHVEVPKDSTAPVTADLSLSRGATMKGRVVEETTNTPLERARIQVEGVGTSGGALSLRYDALTDAQGDFTLDGLPAGRLSLFVSADKHHSRIISGIKAQADASAPQVIALRRTEEGEEPQVELVGIGAVLAPREDMLVLGQIFPGGGADEAGLSTGDGIVSIDGHPVTELGFADAVQHIRGPEGSRLVLGIRKAPGTVGGTAPIVDVLVTRRRLRQ